MSRLPLLCPGAAEPEQQRTVALGPVLGAGAGGRVAGIGGAAGAQLWLGVRDP